MPTLDELKTLQAIPLAVKIQKSIQRIKEWVNHYGEDGVYISFSGGKDSTVLVDLVDKAIPNNNIPLVFCDTGLEYPEIREFVKSYGDRVVWLKPEMTFKQVIEKYGYPVPSKEIAVHVHLAKLAIAENREEDSQSYKKLKGQFRTKDGQLSHYNCARWGFLIDAPFDTTSTCCNIFKKKPSKKYEKESGRHPITGSTTAESKQRETTWLKQGCNAFDIDRPTSTPMAFWTEQDVLLYIKDNSLPIASVYGNIVYTDEDGMEYDEPVFNESMQLKTTGVERTGCMFCLFGAHLPENPPRFVQMKQTHPKQYNYIMRPKEEGGLNYKEVIDFINENTKNRKIQY